MSLKHIVKLYFTSFPMLPFFSNTISNWLKITFLNSFPLFYTNVILIVKYQYNTNKLILSDIVQFAIF